MSEKRLKKVRERLEQENLEALIVDFPVDLFYLTDQELSLGRLVVERERSTLFVDGRYYEACHASLGFPVILTSGYEKESAFGRWWKFAGKRVGFDADKTSYDDYSRLFNFGAELVPLRNPIKKIRAIKDLEEIALLKQAALLGSEGYDYLLSLLKPGIREKELASELELFWLKKGADRLAFAPHIAFGEGASQPHYHSGDRPLKRGDTILIDIGVVREKYHSDMTRVVFLGKPKKELETIYSIVFDAYQSALALCRPGTPIGSLDQAAREVIAHAGFKEFFPHSLGHGVGLEIHELPVIRSTGADAELPLEEGMVITIEPGIYLPKIGGVRLEDTVVITENGYQNLTQRPLSSFPENIEPL